MAAARLLWAEPSAVALARMAGTAARWAFAATIVLSPFRARFLLAARPSPPVYGDFTDLLAWLRASVYRHGHRYRAARLIEKVTGSPPENSA